MRPQYSGALQFAERERANLECCIWIKNVALM